MSMSIARHLLMPETSDGGLLLAPPATAERVDSIDRAIVLPVRGAASGPPSRRQRVSMLTNSFWTKRPKLRTMTRNLTPHSCRAMRMADSPTRLARRCLRRCRNRSSGRATISPLIASISFPGVCCHEPDTVSGRGCYAASTPLQVEFRPWLRLPSSGEVCGRAKSVDQARR